MKRGAISAVLALISLIIALILWRNIFTTIDGFSLLGSTRALALYTGLEPIFIRPASTAPPAEYLEWLAEFTTAVSTLADYIHTGLTPTILLMELAKNSVFQATLLSMIPAFFFAVFSAIAISDRWPTIGIKPACAGSIFPLLLFYPMLMASVNNPFITEVSIAGLAVATAVEVTKHVFGVDTSTAWTWLELSCGLRQEDQTFLVLWHGFLSSHWSSLLVPVSYLIIGTSIISVIVSAIVAKIIQES